MAKKVLGKGLSAIISSSTKPVEELEKGIAQTPHAILELDVDAIEPNPDQPRKQFHDSEIRGLAESIKAVGLIQPILVRKEDSRFYVVAGERRLRAVKSAGLRNIKAILIEADEVRNLTMALIENIQRADLDAIEEAKAYQVLVNRFKLRQQDIAEQVGKDRATIANALRLLNLPDEIQEAITDNTISAGHAKALLSLPEEKQLELFRKIREKGLSVRALEKLVQEENENTSGGTARTAAQKKDAHIRKMEEELVSLLGTKVEIRHSGAKGKIEISYYSLEDFDRIIELIR